MTEDIFSDTTPVVVPDQDTDHLAELVGEDKKFKTLNDLARAKVESDRFIEQLKREQDELRADLKTRIRQEEFLDRIERARSTEGNQPISEPAESTSAMNPEELEQLLERKLIERDQATSARNNLNIVRAKLTEVLGPNYAQRVKEQASSLGVTTDFLNNLAATQPKALYRLLNIDQEPKRDDSLSPPKSMINSEVFKPSSGNFKGWSHYESLLAQDPEKYFTPKIQNEKNRALQELGEEKFYNS